MTNPYLGPLLNTGKCGFPLGLIRFATTNQPIFLAKSSRCVRSYQQPYKVLRSSGPSRLLCRHHKLHHNPEALVQTTNVPWRSRPSESSISSQGQAGVQSSDFNNFYIPTDVTPQSRHFGSYHQQPPHFGHFVCINIRCGSFISIPPTRATQSMASQQRRTRKEPWQHY